MNTETRIEKLQSALQRRFRLDGRGSVNRVQKQLSLGAGYFKNQRRTGRRRVDLKVTLQALEALQTDASEFFASVFGTADAVDRFRSEASRYRKRARQTPAILVHEDCRCHAKSAGTDFDPEALDALRFENPGKLVRRTKPLIGEVSDAEVPVLLGIHASACRVLGRLQEAFVVLGRALELAEERCGRGTLADLVLRASYVSYSGGDLNLALELSERATLIYAGLGDLPGIGKSLVDQGGWLGLLGRTDEELQTFSNALRFLPADSQQPDVRKYRFICLQNLGVTYRKLERLDDARRFAALAHECSRGISPGSFGKLVWLEGSIAKQTGRYSEAERFFREAVAALRQVAPVEAALCTLELVRVQLSRGATSDAYQTAKATTVLLQPLEETPVAAAAVTDLVRCALTGRGLDAALLSRVSRGLGRGRTQKGARPSRPKR
ncbi:MAG: tetratricopeptide repeat protein [Thermoanaerobaculia bacterium]